MKKKRIMSIVTELQEHIDGINNLLTSPDGQKVIRGTGLTVIAAIGLHGEDRPYVCMTHGTSGCISMLIEHIDKVLDDDTV